MSKKYQTAVILITTVVIAGTASLIGPASFALAAGGSEISTLSKLPNAAVSWLAENHCNTIKSSVISGATIWLGLLSPIFAAFVTPPVVLISDYAYRRCVKKWPRCEHAPYERNSNNFFMKCYHKLFPRAEAFVIFGAFLLSTAGLAIAMIEIVTGQVESDLRLGFDPNSYHCRDPSIKISPSANQIIMSMAEPVGKAARLAAYFPVVFFLAGSSLLVLGSAALVGFWQTSARDNERVHLIPRSENIAGYGAGF